MKKIVLVIGAIVIILFLIVIFRIILTTNSSDQDNLNYDRGVNKGIEICEDNYKPMVRQFIPEGNCMKLVVSDSMMIDICEGNELYDGILDIIKSKREGK